MNCRHCGTPLPAPFLDLGHAPPSNAYLREADLDRPELSFPLRVHVCPQCWLVQTRDYSQAHELFSADYAYFSSTSRSWLAHAQQFCETITARLGLGPHSQVIEVASNDGYLLKNFVAAGIPCLGIEPTASTAAAAEALGIAVRREFFGARLGAELAAQGQGADLIVGNNVYAHVPDINDFTAGLKAALNPGGVVSLEFPHLMQLLAQGQFDTIYHEHYSYLSLGTVQRILARQGLRVWDVMTLPTHGGSLRVLAVHAQDPRPTTEAVAQLLAAETAAGLQTQAVYDDFGLKPLSIGHSLLSFLMQQREAGNTVAGYGAAAKGNTLLNFMGIKPWLLPYVCDAAPAKQGQYLPGSHIPIRAPEMLARDRPDYILILPWNLKDEVMAQLAYARDWGARFVTAIPTLQIT